MRRILIAAGAAALITAPIATPAAAACKTTGTVVGGLAGGLLGNSVAGRGARTEGTVLGAGVGALVGRQVAKSTCGKKKTYASSRSYRAAPSNVRYASYQPSCRMETRAYYNQWGELVYAPTQVCR
ncbi:glycine zipper 2TM domain-containing protein [Phenylobacterium sp. J367]|uniref:glycine zipper 2TM domain-containing protein n=1 Tax=Phenylobacterium sp. J367 TaxID=2898435 RepID=UPI002150A0BD|nr:glycine zipper 2TM domain-containing protein [Phenylobacterium sp. J367]MCR5877649.1 glycine zipper 2TM domain-containing protein [Phenylobacterium sp. J367]